MGLAIVEETKGTISRISIPIILIINAYIVEVTEDGHGAELTTDEAHVTDQPGAVLRRHGTPMTGGGSGRR